MSLLVCRTPNPPGEGRPKDAQQGLHTLTGPPFLMLPPTKILPASLGCFGSLQRQSPSQTHKQYQHIQAQALFSVKHHLALLLLMSVRSSDLGACQETKL